MTTPLKPPLEEYPR